MSPASIYNRLAILVLPLISFAACVGVLAHPGYKGVIEFADAAFSFGLKRAFPMLAVLGLLVGIADWSFPQKRKVLTFIAIFTTAIAVGFGYITAQNIIYF